MRSSLAIAIILSIYMITSGILCEPLDCEEDTVTNESHINFNVENIKSGYTPYDTIWLKSEFSSIINLDNKSGTMNIDGYKCFLHQNIAKVEEDGSVNEGTEAFDYVNQKGSVRYDSLSAGDPGLSTHQAYIAFDCTGGSCGFNIGYVPKNPGKYAIITRWGGFYPDSDTTYCWLRNEFRNNIQSPVKINIDGLLANYIEYIYLPTNGSSHTLITVKEVDNLIVMEVN